MALLFTARVVCVQAVAGHAPEPKVLNAPEDLGAALAQSAAAVDQNAAAQALNVAAVDLIAVGDHGAVVVRIAGAFPHAAVAQGERVLAHNYAQVDPDVARVSRFAPGVRVGHRDPFPPVAGFPVVRAVRFAQAGRFSRAAQYVPQVCRFPLPEAWWEKLTVAVLSAPSR